MEKDSDNTLAKALGAWQNWFIWQKLEELEEFVFSPAFLCKFIEDTNKY